MREVRLELDLVWVMVRSSNNGPRASALEELALQNSYQPRIGYGRPIQELHLDGRENQGF